MQGGRRQTQVVRPREKHRQDLLPPRNAVLAEIRARAVHSSCAFFAALQTHELRVKLAIYARFRKEASALSRSEAAYNSMQGTDRPPILVACARCIGTNTILVEPRCRIRPRKSADQVRSIVLPLHICRVSTLKE
jgi:hypothetical protein